MHDEPEIKFKSLGSRKNAPSTGTHSKPSQLRPSQSKPERYRPPQATQAPIRKVSAAKKRRLKRQQRIRYFVLCISVVFLLSALTAGAFLLGKYNKLKNKASTFSDHLIETNSITEDTINVLNGYTNIAVFGVDARDSEHLEKDVNADVNMIISINHDTHDIKLVSVYRDTYLDVQSKGVHRYNKLNEAYSEGGPQQALNTLNRNLDLVMSDYITVNWAAVANVINALGGIELDITDTELEWINGYITETVESTNIASQHLTHTGVQPIDGIQAVAYCRIRYGGGADYKRTERQRIVVGKILEKVKQTDLITLNKIVDEVINQLSTSLEIGEIMTLAKDITKYSISDTIGFPFDKEAFCFDKLGGLDCVFPATLESNVIQLHMLLFENETYTPSSTVQQISAQIIKDSGVTESTNSSGKTESTYLESEANEFPVER